MIYTKIYVGSNNETHDLELRKIIDVMNMWQNDYTITTGTGVWKKTEEQVAIIEIYGAYNLGIIPELKRVCMQESIMVTTSIVDVTF